MTGGRAAADLELSSAKSATPTAVRRRYAPETLKQRLIVADAAVVGVAVLLAFIVQGLLRADHQLGVRRPHLILATVTFPAWPVMFSLNKLYLARAVERPTEEFRRICAATAAAVGVMLAVSFALQFKTLSRLWMLLLVSFVIVGMTIERAVARRIFNRLRRNGDICRPVVIVGTDADAIALMHAAQRAPHLGYKVVGFIGPDDIGVRGGVAVLGDISDTEKVLEATGATGVLISLSSVDSEVVNRLTRDLTDAGYHVALSSGLRDIDIVRFRAQDLDGRTLIYIEQVERGGWRAVAKRVFDITIAVVALIVTLPITIVAAIAIKRSSPGPIIFRQTRVGKNGEHFEVLKFRTMVVDAEERLPELMAHNEADGPLFKMKRDPRVTRVGAILRKLSIDEIPQFWNVLRGEMSVVGPRPALPSEVEKWSEDLHDRLRVLPGITGMWQVSGRSDTTFDEYKRLDLYYVDNWSLAHDVRIVLKTFAAVLAQRGAR